MLGAGASESWPVWLRKFVMFSASIANGIWVAGAFIALASYIGLPFEFAALVGLPVMFFSGRYFNRMSERMDTQADDAKRRGWEAHHNREDDQ